MANKQQNETKSQETVSKPVETVSKPPKAVPSPTYTVDEFANAPSSVDAKSADIVRAAFNVAGKESATLDEAKKIIKDFKNKEVK